MREYPYPEYDGVRSIALGVVFSILTLGIYYFYWQYKQMETLNAWLGREEYNFVLWLVLFFLTCGIFELYYEYQMARGINEIQENNSLHTNQDLALICVLGFYFFPRLGPLLLSSSGKSTSSTVKAPAVSRVHLARIFPRWAGFRRGILGVVQPRTRRGEPVPLPLSHPATLPRLRHGARLYSSCTRQPRLRLALPPLRILPHLVGLSASRALPVSSGRAWLALPPSLRKGLAGGVLGARADALGLSLAARLAAQRPDRDVGPHFESVESLALRVAVDAGVFPAVA